MSKDNKLWFDVGIKRYTTNRHFTKHEIGLWFDVGIKRYTTLETRSGRQLSCGLM